MSPKAITRFLLLAFVVVAVVILISRQLSERFGATSTSNPVEQRVPANGVLVYYFHGDVRCPTCRKIEEYARAAVQAKYPTQLASGQLSWQVVNYELPENKHFIGDFELVSPTVVLVKRENGEQRDWQNLARVWELVGDEPGFLSYVQIEVEKMLATTATARNVQPN